jgi:hypothetical protein
MAARRRYLRLQERLELGALLGHEIVGPGGERLLDRLLLGKSGDDDELGERGSLLNLGDEIKSIIGPFAPTQPHIEQHHVEFAARLQQADGRRSVRRCLDVVSLPLEDVLVRLPEQRVIVDDEDPAERVHG